MVWIIGTFISEMVGMFVFVFLSLFTILSSESTIINLKTREKRFFIAIGIGIDLIVAKIVAYAIADVSQVRDFGYLNSGVAFAYAIAANDFHYLLPSLIGEMSGTFLASFFLLVIFLGSYGNNTANFKAAQAAFAFPENENAVIKTAVGELLASFLFIGIALALIISDQTVLIIGLAITIILLTFGLRFNLVINIFSTIMPVLVGIFITKPALKQIKIYFKDFGIGMVFNLSASSILGGFYLMLS